MAPPKPAIFWPVTITAGVNDKIDFNRGGVKVATVAAGTYYSPLTLLAAVDAALTAADGATTWTLDFPTTGRVRVNASANFVLLFSTGANAAASPRDLLGFGTVDTASSTSAVAEHQHQHAWYADDPVADDTRDLASFERAQTVALSGRVKGLTHATRYRREVVLTYLPAWKRWTEDEGAYLNEAIERLWADGWARFRWFPDQSDLATGSDYALDLDTAKGTPRERLSPGSALYSLTLKLRRYV